MNIQALTQKVAAELLSVTPRTLRDRENAGESVPRNPDGAYPGPALVAWDKARSLREDGALDLDQQRARLAKEQADKTAMENAVRRGDLCDLNVLSNEMGRQMANYRARMLGAPSKLAHQVSPENPNHARDVIEKELHEILNDLADGWEAAIHADTSSESGKRDQDLAPGDAQSTLSANARPARGRATRSRVVPR